MIGAEVVLLDNDADIADDDYFPNDVTSVVDDLQTAKEREADHWEKMTGGRDR